MKNARVHLFGSPFIALLFFVTSMPGFAAPAKPFEAFHLTPAKVNTASPQPCPGKETCLFVYVTPWCPHCNSSVPAIKDLQTKLGKSKKVGVAVVIGGDPLPKLERMAGKLSPVATFTDADGAFAQTAGVRGFPMWVVMDANRKPVSQFSGGVQKASEALEMLKIVP